MRGAEDTQGGGAPRRALRRLAVALAALVLACAALEGLARAAARLRGEPYSAAATERSIREVADALDRDLAAFDAAAGAAAGAAPGEGAAENAVHPYFGWSPIAGAQPFEKSSAHFRSARAASTYDVLVVGGSVSAGFTRNAGAHFAELLAGDPRFANRPVELLGFGYGSFKQPQQLNFVGFVLSLGWRPDAVVNLDGFNEVALPVVNAQNGFHPLFPSVGQWGHLAARGALGREELDLLLDMRAAQLGARSLAARALGLGLEHSAVLGRAALGHLRALQSRYAEAYEAYLAHLAPAVAARGAGGPAFAPEFEAIGALAVRNWLECSRSLAALCRERGIHYLHVLQPTMHDDGSKPLTEREREVGTASIAWQRAARELYPKLREAGRELTGHEVAFLDASRAFADVEATLYYDACHFSLVGHELLAERIAEAFLATLPGELPRDASQVDGALTQSGLR